MGKIAVVYKSEYEASKQYAKWISAALDADLFKLDGKTVDALLNYPTIIYGAGIYAGGIAGASVIRKNFRKLKDKNFIMFTVGLNSTEDSEKFKPVLKKSFSPEMFARVKVFHFRGSMDYKSLRPLHRAMMWGLVKALSKKDPKKLSDDDKQIVSTYGKSVNFMDEASIEPLLVYVCSLNGDA